jgi:nucleotide-binding universal stress UspA family protein
MNPIRQILVHVDGSPASGVRLDAARALAVQHGASVQALFAVTPMIALSPLGYSPVADYAALLSEYERERRTAAKAQFDGHAGNDGRLQWLESDAEPIWAVSRAALCADLLVLGQRDPTTPSNLPADFVESVLMQSGKPALVLPYVQSTAPSGRVALVAWKNSRESARALADALPLLAKAEQVHVALWPEPEGVAAPEPDPVAFLRRHGIQAQRQVQPRLDRKVAHQLGELLLSLASDLDADLLVMGCYGHGRAREWVMGGVSRTVLSSMTLPVLMAH